MRLAARALRSVALLAAPLDQSAVPAQMQDTKIAEELDEVVVSGRMPGPPLWKVTSGEHVLWILPIVKLYPKKMEWESARVQKLISESQEYIFRPYATYSVSTSNPFLIARLLPLYRASTRLPDGKRLADVLPPDLYRRFGKLKARYFPRDRKIAKLTIRQAGIRMQEQVLEHENLEIQRA